MLYSNLTAAEKRVRLRELLQPGAAVQFPGAYTPLSAKLVQEQGFSGLYISGAVLANELALPDIGLTTLSEVAQRAGQIARVTDLPAIVDADTGFGEPMNVARTIQELENAGLAGCHLEDQVNPKRCGHLDNKAVDRAKALVDAGADAIFPEALKDLSEFEAVCHAVDVPVLANMTEFGKSELFTRDQLASAGVALVIYPVTLLRSALGAMERTLSAIRAEGTQQGAVGEMLTRARLYELVDYEGYNGFDSSVFNFSVPGLGTN